MGSPGHHPSKGYNNYGTYLREKFAGQRVFKVIVDAGFTCPNRDGSKGYGGCIYCNVDSYTPALPRSLAAIRAQIEQGMARARASYAAEKFIIYFQPNTNTYAPVATLRALFDEALSVCPQDVVGLAVGTRPDCLDAEKILLLESYTKHLMVDLEMGMESIHEATLLKLNRGCTHQHLITILNQLENSPLNLCIHTVFGFPGETQDMMLAYAREINRFPQVKFVKLHHLHIVAGSIMAAHYQREPFKLFELDEYIDFLCAFLPLLRPDIVIQRLFGIADLKLLIAPNWNLKKVRIQTHIDQTILRRGITQGSRVADARATNPT
jgi:radical SAM protein (TIGR01212 family)